MKKAIHSVSLKSFSSTQGEKITQATRSSHRIYTHALIISRGKSDWESDIRIREHSIAEFAKFPTGVGCFWTPERIAQRIAEHKAGIEISRQRIADGYREEEVLSWHQSPINAMKSARGDAMVEIRAVTRS